MPIKTESRKSDRDITSNGFYFDISVSDFRVFEVLKMEVQWRHLNQNKL